MWNEVLNCIDILTKEQIEDIFLNYSSTIIVIGKIERRKEELV